MAISYNAFLAFFSVSIFMNSYILCTKYTLSIIIILLRVKWSQLWPLGNLQTTFYVILMEPY